MTYIYLGLDLLLYFLLQLLLLAGLLVGDGLRDGAGDNLGGLALHRLHHGLVFLLLARLLAGPSFRLLFFSLKRE